MYYQEISDHGFVFPDISNLPEVKQEQRFEDNAESNALVKQCEDMFNAKKGVNQFIAKVDQLIELSKKQMPLQEGEQDIINGWRKKLGRQYTYQITTKRHNFYNNDSKNKHFIRLVGQGVTFGSSDIGYKIKHVLQSDIDLLLQKQDQISPIGAYDRANPKPKQGGQVQDILNEEFKKQGILDAASTYMGRSMTVKKVTLHISYPTDSHVFQQYRDVNLASQEHPVTTNLHIDPKFDLLKGAFYLGEVTEKQGPIWFVRTSNRWKHNSFESVWGRANAVGNYMEDKLHRSAAFRLPKRLRINYQFGRNLLDGTAEQKKITDNIVKLTTNNTGNFALFDPGFTMHTGGRVDEGMRINLQLQFR